MSQKSSIELGFYFLCLTFEKILWLDFWRLSANSSFKSRGNVLGEGNRYTFQNRKPLYINIAYAMSVSRSNYLHVENFWLDRNGISLYRIFSFSYWMVSMRSDGLKFCGNVVNHTVEVENRKQLVYDCG